MFYYNQTTYIICFNISWLTKVQKAFRIKRLSNGGFILNLLFSNQSVFINACEVGKSKCFYDLDNISTHRGLG